MSIYERGETYVNRTSIWDRNKTKVNPSKVSFSLIDPYDKTLVSYTSMSSDATGEYYYNYLIASTATYGAYKTRVKSTSSTGNISIINGQFYVMPWDAVDYTRSIMGLSTDDKSISDDDLHKIIWASYLYTLKDIHTHHMRETVLGNPDTGVYFNGSNTSFQTRSYPIADINGDGVVTGWKQQSSGTDVQIWWVDSSGHWARGKLTVHEPHSGEITIKQQDGSAIPSDNNGVFVDYYTEYDGFDTDLFREAVVRLACHEIQNRFTTTDRVNIGDLMGNKPIIMVSPSRWMNEYRRITRNLTPPCVTGV